MPQGIQICEGVSLNLRDFRRACGLREALSRMDPGKWYVQKFSDEILYFRADSQLGHGGWQGKIVRWYAGSRTPKKGVQLSVKPSSFHLWTPLSDADVPKEVLAKA